MLNPYFFSFLKNMERRYIYIVPNENLVLQGIGRTRFNLVNKNTVNFNINFTLGKLVIASLTALVVSNNVNAEEIIFSSNDLNTAINQSIEVAVTEINTLDIQAAVKQQIATMNMEQNVRQFLALAKIEENEKPISIFLSE